MYFAILFVLRLFTFETFKGIFVHRLIKEISKDVVFLVTVYSQKYLRFVLLRLSICLMKTRSYEGTKSVCVLSFCLLILTEVLVTICLK